jgi:hypothetical protein
MSTLDEKKNASEHIPDSVQDSDGYIKTEALGGDEESVGFDKAATKKLYRRLDWHLVPFLALLYLYAPRHLLTLNPN